MNNHHKEIKKRAIPKTERKVDFDMKRFFKDTDTLARKLRNSKSGRFADNERARV